MKKTLKVEGMMCGHCEARVKKALEALPEVTEAVVSHETGTAIVTLNADVSDDVLKKAVEDQDYPVTGIQRPKQPDRKRKTAARNINVQRSFCVGHGAFRTVRCTSAAALPQQCSTQQRPAARSPAARGA